MISITDYDTKFEMDSKLIGKLRSKSGILIDQLNNVPIFFVKEGTMDKHCSKLSLKRDCTKEINRSLEMENEPWIREEKAKEIIKRLDNCMGKSSAMGCYIPDRDEISDKPHILICPERIKYRNKNQFNDLLLEVLIHELTHAYFSTGGSLKDLSKHIIEESLCEAYAFSKFNNNEEIFEFMADQKRPPEYTSFKFWTELSINHSLIMLMNDWKNKNYRSFSFLFNTFCYGDAFLFRSSELELIATIVLSFS